MQWLETKAGKGSTRQLRWLERKFGEVRLSARRGDAEQRDLPLRGHVGDAASHVLDTQHPRHDRPTDLLLVPGQGPEGSAVDVPRLGPALPVAAARDLDRGRGDPGLPRPGTRRDREPHDGRGRDRGAERPRSRRTTTTRTSGRVRLLHRGVAVVTGASSGIGAATARHLAKEGFDVVIGARRVDRLREVADASGSAGARARRHRRRVGGRVLHRDRRVPRARQQRRRRARPRPASRRADLDGWQAMFDANVLGTVRMTKALLPKIEASGDGHIVLMGSVAGLEGYIGGAGYNAAKFAVHAMHQVLRMELLGRPIRVTEIDPGACETEFSLVRFDGDVERAAKVYEGLTPLTADDVAECVTFAVTRPSHVNIDQIVLMPRDQANARMFHRRPDPDQPRPRPTEKGAPCPIPSSPASPPPSSRSSTSTAVSTPPPPPAMRRTSPSAESTRSSSPARPARPRTCR